MTGGGRLPGGWSDDKEPGYQTYNPALSSSSGDDAQLAMSQSPILTLL